MEKKVDERRFVDVVDTIKGAEKDVDAVLKAAKLERHEMGYWERELHLMRERDHKEALAWCGLLAIIAVCVTAVIIFG